MIVDTSVLYALFDENDPAHVGAVDAIGGALHQRKLVVSPLVVAELDYLVARKYGVSVELTVLHELGSGAWELPALSDVDLRAAAGLIEKYRDLNIGVADASLVVLADRYRTTTIATLDRRHFEALRSLDGRPFDILP